ncbi:MAG: XRE family transcriptional regulator [Comamonadaceae bacterium]|nr:XRE family transcriptional regulator [Comamonadaceae bacterium]
MIDYTPPTTDDLARLKDRLGYTGTQMAELLSVSGNSQWRKYTGGATPRPLNLHMCFFMAARLALDEAALRRVAAAMQDMGALVDPDAIAETASSS